MSALVRVSTLKCGAPFVTALTRRRGFRTVGSAESGASDGLTTRGVPVIFTDDDSDRELHPDVLVEAVPVGISW